MKTDKRRVRRWKGRAARRLLSNGRCPLCGRSEPMGLNLCLFCRAAACGRCIAAGECCDTKLSRE
jgi:hypothetical protein